MLARSVFVLMILVFVVGACSPGGGEPAAPDGATAKRTTTAAEETGSPTATTTTPPESAGRTVPETDAESAATEETVEVGVAYLTALARADPARRQDAVGLAASGTPAYAYAQFQVAQARAIREQGREQPDAELRRSGDGIALCYADQCATYSAFVVEGEPARLVTFDIQGLPVGDRVVVGDDVDPVTSGPVTVELIGALQATSEESTVIAFEVRNGGGVALDVALYLSEYVGPGGETYPVRDAIGPAELEPNAAATAVIVVERAGFGGTLTVETATGEERHTVDISVPRP